MPTPADPAPHRKATPGNGRDHHPRPTPLGLDTSVTRAERETLDKALIVRRALVVIDRGGLPALTMRALGGDLGVEAMSLYRYVPSKQTLLDNVVASLMQQVQIEAMDEHSDWRDLVHELAHGLRSVASTHPRAFPLLITATPAAPWLRPPLCHLAWADLLLARLLADGFEPATAAAGYRAFNSGLLGPLLAEVRVREPGPPASRHGLLRVPVHLPTARALEARLARLDTVASEFTDALRDLVTGLSAMRDSQ